MNKKTYTAPQVEIVEAETVVMVDQSKAISASRDEKATEVKSNTGFYQTDEEDNSFWKSWFDDKK